MPNSTASSGTSAGCRPDAANPAHAAPVRVLWRPSRYLLGAIAALTLLAPVAVGASELPAALAWPLGLAAAGYGVACFRREARRAPVELVLRPGADATVDGAPASSLQVAWRGPLAFARWRDGAGRWQRRAWWPDTLPPAARRELRLAAPGDAGTARDASVAP
jgi:toxin CptA